MNDTLLPALIGLGTGLALIMAIGAQNAYLLRLGIDGRPATVLAVVLVCAVSDALLITAGVVGIGGLLEALPAVMVAVRLLGAGFLVVYGLFAAYRALRPGQAEVLVPAEEGAGPVGPASRSALPERDTTLTTKPEQEGGPKSALVTRPSNTRKHTGLKAAVLTALALTWLNPHVYLDTVLFLGSVANQQVGDARWWWAGGAVAGSFLWFFSLGFGARLLRPVFARPGAWRVLDGIIAAVMLTLGVRLALGA
ncbi:LysE/ArgO family amino acid transporter [Nocardiopsis valliformis]|uniref:LysE/ArgO family amino acid transporter n=1 Tax=Nocardiopsis valliformis TaxID=239974 RepID=UPI000348576D|nr:LysE family transporter [Nocardiopsis valliformis]